MQQNVTPRLGDLFLVVACEQVHYWVKRKARPVYEGPQQTRQLNVIDN